MRRLISVLSLVTLIVEPMAAQRIRPSDTTHVQKTLFTWRDAVLAGAFAGTTVALFPVDKRWAQRVQDSSFQRNRSLKDVGRALEYITDPGSLVIGTGLYLIGRTRHLEDVEDLGLHGTEAVLLSGALVIGIRSIAGRTRPYVSNDSNPHDFHFMHGIIQKNYQSFPSGHAAAAFGAAAAVTSESQRWWPGGTWIVAPVLYGGAALLGVTRTYNNEHWASDVVLGAGIGTFSGLKVVRYNHSHPGNVIDRALLAMTVAPDGMGDVRIGWHLEH